MMLCMSLQITERLQGRKTARLQSYKVTSGRSFFIIPDSPFALACAPHPN